MLVASTLLHNITREFQRVPLQSGDHRWKYGPEVIEDAETFAELVVSTYLLEKGSVLFPGCGLFVLQGYHDRYDRWVRITAAFDALKKIYRTDQLCSKTQHAVIAAISYSVAGVELDLLHMLSPYGRRVWNINRYQ